MRLVYNLVDKKKNVISHLEKKNLLGPFGPKLKIYDLSLIYIPIKDLSSV